jgi:hypothetical protein
MVRHARSSVTPLPRVPRRRLRWLGVAVNPRALACGVALWAAAAAAAPADAIQPWSANPWYWQFKGQPVFLAGGTDDDNLFQWPREPLVEQLQLLVASGGNYVRNTMSDRRDRGFELYPYEQLDDGRYDLDRWNAAYWDRFEVFLAETARREIIVQIEVWDRFDYSREHWEPHPYNPGNTITYDYESSGLAVAYPNHPGRNEQPFFYTVPPLRNNEIVLRFQRRFVDRMLAYALKYDHILYCIDNETSGDEAWGRWWAEYIKESARRAGRRVYVTEMWDDWDLRDEEHRRTFDHPELYDFVDVSQNNHQKGEVHWNNFQWVRQYLAPRPRPINTVKTYGADGNRFGHTDQDGLERVWRHVLGGAAAVRFHRPDSGLGLSAKAQATLTSIRLLESHVKPWDLQPDHDLLRDRDENEAYLASRPGQAYVVFFTDGGRVGLDLTGQDGRFDIRWLDIAAARMGEAETVGGGSTIDLAPPGDGLWVALVLAADRIRTPPGSSSTP